MVYLHKKLHLINCPSNKVHNSDPDALTCFRVSYSKNVSGNFSPLTYEKL